MLYPETRGSLYSPSQKPDKIHFGSCRMGATTAPSVNSWDEAVLVGCVSLNPQPTHVTQKLLSSSNLMVVSNKLVEQVSGLNQTCDKKTTTQIMDRCWLINGHKCLPEQFYWWEVRALLLPWDHQSWINEMGIRRQLLAVPSYVLNLSTVPNIW